MVGGSLRLSAWEAALSPSDPKHDYILSGIREGFRITTEDYLGPPVMVNNYRSATDPEFFMAVEHQIQEEISNGRYIPIKERPTIVSALGAIPKDNNKVRLIHDCSRPHGQAVNDFAALEKFSYQSIKDAMQMITPGCYLAKIDLASAYWSVKIHPADYDRAGLAWTFSGDSKPTFLYDSRLMFGARKSPAIFNELTQAVCRMMHKKGHQRIIAYLDDFLIIGETYQDCLQQMQVLMTLLRSLGFAINYNKVIGPAQCLTFLGVELDTAHGVVRLPSDKLAGFLADVNHMLNQRTITKRTLQSLAGKLSWASQVIQGGRPHLRRIIDRINVLHGPKHRTRVTQDMRKDLVWWIEFAKFFNGALPILDCRPRAPVCIDACDVGGGGYYAGQGFNIQWSEWPGASDKHINFKEVLALEPAAHLWAPLWANSIITVHSDNQAAVGIINKGSSSEPFVMDSLRRVFWLSAIWNFSIKAVYYPGRYNTLADAFSRIHETDAMDRILKALKVTCIT